MAMIRPETEMKDSGIEYVGAIPKDWDLVRLRDYFGERKNKNKDGKETNLLSLSYGRIIRKNIDKTDGLQSADSTRRFCGAKRTRCGASGLN